MGLVAMIEVHYTCTMCGKSFSRTATTEDEIKDLQHTIWMVEICAECNIKVHTWDC